MNIRCGWFTSEWAATVRAEDGKEFTTNTGRTSDSSGARSNHQPSIHTSEKVPHKKTPYSITPNLYLNKLYNLLSLSKCVYFIFYYLLNLSLLSTNLKCVFYFQASSYYTRFPTTTCSPRRSASSAACGRTSAWAARSDTVKDSGGVHSDSSVSPCSETYLFFRVV